MTELAEEPYGDLMNLARSMNEQFESVEIDTDAPKKDEVVESLQEFDPEGNRSEGWTVEVDGSREEVNLLAVQTPDNQSSGGSSGPTDKTVLYGLTRAETTQERLQAIREALEEHTDFTLVQQGTEEDPKYSIILPAEAQEDPRTADRTETIGLAEELSEDGVRQAIEERAEEINADDFAIQGSGDEANEDNEIEYSVDFFGVTEEDDEDEESESESDAVESDSEESEEEASEESEESDESESESAESEESDEDDEQVSENAYRQSLDDKTRDELYDLAIEHDVDGRSDMDKAELIDALVEENEKVAA